MKFMIVTPKEAVCIYDNFIYYLVEGKIISVMFNLMTLDKITLPYYDMHELLFAIIIELYIFNIITL
jgi:hypothetical protein